MITEDENGKRHFSSLTDRELMSKIQILLIDGLYPNITLTDEIYEEIHELYMRLNLLKITFKNGDINVDELYSQKIW